MSDAVNELTSSFVIRELTGDKRSLRLRERALPYRPFNLSGSQRNNIDWYPGSPIGTLQVFGAQEDETSVNGWWKDAFLGGQERGNAPAEVTGESTADVDGTEGTLLSSSALTTASALVNVVDDMRRKGQEVEVTWLDKVRRGIIEKFSQKWHTGHDVEWEIGFKWISQGESLSDTKFKDDTATDIGDLPNMVQEELTGVLGEDNDLTQSAGEQMSDLLAVIDEASAGLADMADSLTDAVVSIGNTITAPNAALRKVAGILDGIKLAAGDLVDIIDQYLDGASLDQGMDVFVAALPDNGSLSFGVVLANRGAARARGDACVRLRDLAARQQAQLLGQATSEMLKIFQARDDQDLRQVSQDAYGTPDAWLGLMIYNNLTSSGLRAGQVVFVPAQPPQGTC